MLIRYAEELVKIINFGLLDNLIFIHQAFIS